MCGWIWREREREWEGGKWPIIVRHTWVNTAIPRQQTQMLAITPWPAMAPHTPSMHAHIPVITIKIIIEIKALTCILHTLHDKLGAFKRLLFCCFWKGINNIWLAESVIAVYGTCQLVLITYARSCSYSSSTQLFH